MQTDSVTEWIHQLKAGDRRASQELWQRFIDRLVRLARQKLAGAHRRVSDEEDVALSAFNGFFQGVEESRFPRLDDRDDLWQVLVMLVSRKAVDHRRRESAAKRGAGAVAGESAFGVTDSQEAGLNQVIGSEPSPEFVAEFAEQFEQLQTSLGDETLQRIVVGKMEGRTNKELAGELGLHVGSIERKLRLIRRTWQESDCNA